MFLSACDRSIAIVRYEFGQWPRLVYIANVDTELDFEGVTFYSIMKNGERCGIYPFPNEPVEWMVISHDIDFNTPGEYRVVIVRNFSHNSFETVFYIQVMHYEDFIRLNE